MTKRLAKWLVRLAIAIPSTILVLLLMLGTLLLTPPGLKLIIWGAEKALPQLQIARAEGALLSGFHLYEVKFDDPELFIELSARELELNLDVSCLTTPAVCVDKLALNGLDFVLSDVAPGDDTAPPSEPLTEVVLPLPVQISEVILDDIKLDILGTKIAWQTFHSGIGMTGRVATLSPTEWQNIELTLPESEPDAEVSQPVVSDPEPVKLPEVLIPLDAHIEQINVRDFRMHGDSPVVVNHLGLRGFAADHQVKVGKLELDIPEVNADLSGDIELIGGYPLDAVLNARLKQTELKGQKLALNVTGSVEQLSLNAKLSGVIPALLKGELSPLDPDLPFDATLSETSVQWPLTGEADYQAQISRFNASGSLKGYQLDGRLQAQGKEIPDLALKLAGKGDLGQLDLKLVKLDTLGGQVLGDAWVSWEKQVRWRANLTLENIQPGLQWPKAEGNISGSLATSGYLTEKGGWFADLPLLALQGDFRGYPLKINGDIQAQDLAGNGDIKLVTDSISLAHGPNTLFASGRLDKEWQMELALNLPDFAKSVQGLKGHAKGDVTVRGPLKTPRIGLDLNIGDADWKQEATIKRLSLNGQLTPLPVPTGDLTLKADGLAYQDQSVDSVTLAFDGNEQQHQLTLDLLSDIAEASLAINGSLTQEPHLAWSGALSRARLKSVQGPWQLDHPAKVSFDGSSNRVSVQAHCWLQADSSLCLSEDIDVGESGEASLALNNFSFAQLAKLMPAKTRLQGGANASVWAKWAPGQLPEVKAEVGLSEGQVTRQLEAPLTLGWQKVSLGAELKEDRLSLNWLLDLTDNGSLKGRAAIDKVQADEPNIEGELALAGLHPGMLKPLLGEFSRLDADIHSDLTFSGPVRHPQVFGDFTIEKLTATGEITPVDIENGKLEATLNGYSGTLTASIPTPDGVLSLDGNGDWKDLDAWNTRVRVFADEINVNLPPVVQMKVIPDMTITANPQLARIDGDIALPWARIEVEELPESAIGVSADEVMLDENYQVVEREQALPMTVETNINIKIGDDFKLKAFGLEGGLKGQLKVSQKDKGPYVVGEVNITDGTYRSFGQDLIINKGKILMNGPVDLPYVSIEAIRNPDNTRDGVTAGIRVDGPASEPAVTIFSDPSMPQANQLSYLLRGQDIDAETGGNMMTTTLIGLSLAKSGKLVGELGQAFGVQDLQLDTAGSGDESQVTVSGYILPGLQVKYGVGIFNSLGEFTVRYRLMTDLYLEAVSGTTSAVDLLYQFEFD